MKKVLCTVLAVVMAVVCFAGCSAPAAEGGNETGGSAASGDTLLNLYTWEGMFPQEVLDAFSKAVEGLTGCVYEPIALLASQVVAGMNYCLLCRLTVVYPDAQPTYALVYVYQNIEGACELARVEDITFSIQEPVAE